MEIAKEIVRQIGNMALSMLGAKNLLAGERSLQFDVRGSKKANRISVTLAWDDTYTVAFFKGRGLSLKKVAESEGVYVDNLRGVIAQGTGLYVSL